jgi:Tudor domain
MKVFIVNERPNPQDPCYVCCIAESNLRDFLELYKMINVYGSKRSSCEFGIPRENGKMCLAFANGQWHRACVSNTIGDGKPECLLLDIMKIQKVKITNIIPMPTIFNPLPIMVEICKIYGVDKDSESLKNLVQVNKLIEVDEILEVDKEIVLKVESLYKK